MLLKVCGLKHKDNITQVAALSPAYMGFIFYKKSQRYFSANAPESIILSIPKHINRVGVFVDEEREEVLLKAEKYKLDFVQLHGNESPEYCHALSHDVNIIKAFGVDDDFDFKTTLPYKPHCKFFLFDTKTTLHGGSGLAFNWQKLKEYDNEKAFFLSGGIDLENVEAIKKMTGLKIHAIDVNSKFETEPGLKDINKLELLFSKLK